jgi:hypothetical protein
MPRVASLLCLISLGLLTSCSSFGWRWNSSSTPAAANPAALMDGKWDGTWQSDKTDYHGRIQALSVHRTETIVDKKRVEQYECAFQMYWFDIPYYDFTMVMNASEMDDGRLHFEGQRDMGYFFGGILRLDGFIYPKKDVMYCDYSSEKDSGTYKLERVLKNPK